MGVARLVLNRPDAANAITPDQRNRTIELLEGASNDLNIRCVIITAAGQKHFCTGADLRVSKIPVNPGPADAPEKALGDVGRNIKRGAQRLIGAIMDCEKPVIAAVNGTAAGIGDPPVGQRLAGVPLRPHITLQRQQPSDDQFNTIGRSDIQSGHATPDEPFHLLSIALSIGS